MKLTSNAREYVIHKSAPVRDAISRMNERGLRTLFVVGDAGELLGSFSDGDFRRWIERQEHIDLYSSVSSVMHTKVVSVREGATYAQMKRALGENFHAVPVLDRFDRVFHVVARSGNRFEISGRKIGASDQVFIIAEIGNNHNGSTELGRELINQAAAAGVDCVKFQMRDLEALYVNKGDEADPASDLGDQYTLGLLNKFQLPPQEIFGLMDYATSVGLISLCTPWDEPSLEKLVAYGAPALKLASADFTNTFMLKAAAETGLPLICSTGMTTEAEIEASMDLLQRRGAPVALLHCNSTYPAPDFALNLRYINRLKSLTDAVIGYSGHERGIGAAIGAVAMGARIIEKHFTVDKTMEGVDHKVSLLPGEMTELVRGVRQLEQALGSDAPRSLSQGERMNREALGKSVVARIGIPAGTAIEQHMLEIKSPGKGLRPYRIDELIGLRCKVAKNPGDFFYESEISGAEIGSRHYHFNLPWGLPVRHHDLNRLAKLSNPDLLELHLSYEDLELEHEQFIGVYPELQLVVHAPELFRGEHILDLASGDPVIRGRSLAELQGVIDLARRLAPRFRNESPVKLVVNVGGATDDRHLSPTEIRGCLHRLVESIEALDTTDVEILPQTMPPFPWHFGGQRYHNLFVTAEQIGTFCVETGMRVCLDVSHSRLSCNLYKKSFSGFLESVLPHAAHLHIADAEGVDGEGLQIGDGDIDWINLWASVQKYGRSPSFIPEIWQGHKNEGEGFWKALAALERLKMQADEVVV